MIRRLASAALVAALISGVALSVSVPSSAQWEDRVNSAVVLRAAETTTTTTLPPSEANGPIFPGNQATEIDVVWNIQSAVQFCANISVTTPSPTPVAWRVGVDSQAIPFNQVVPSHFQPWNIGLVEGPDDEGVILVGGSGAAEFISSHQGIDIQICVWGGNAPPGFDSGPETFTYSVGRGAAFSSNHACAEVTILGHYDTFHIGFEVVVDWEALVEEAVTDEVLTPAQGSELIATGLNSFYGGGGSWDSSHAGSVYTVWGTDSWNTMGIRGGQVIVLFACTS